MTEADEASGDVNACFQEATSSETGKTVYKSLLCEKSWETIVSTARKGHLATRARLAASSTSHGQQATTSHPAKRQVVTQLIEAINADDLINADQDNVSRLINAELHQHIKAARDVPNRPRNFEVERKTNLTN